MSAELAARRTAAGAAVADFRGAVDRYIRDQTGTVAAPYWQDWAYRLALDVERLLEITGQEMSCGDKGSVKRDNVHEA